MNGFLQKEDVENKLAAPTWVLAINQKESAKRARETLNTLKDLNVVFILKEEGKDHIFVDVVSISGDELLCIPREEIEGIVIEGRSRYLTFFFKNKVIIKSQIQTIGILLEGEKTNNGVIKND